jgi:hypothetical protein
LKHILQEFSLKTGSDEQSISSYADRLEKETEEITNDINIFLNIISRKLKK